MLVEESFFTLPSPNNGFVGVLSVNLWCELCGNVSVRLVWEQITENEEDRNIGNTDCSNRSPDRGEGGVGGACPSYHNTKRGFG